MKKIITYFLLCFLSIGSLIAQVPSYVPTNGLVGWWPFNGNANDESGNKLNGSVYGATPATNRVTNDSSCYSFDGEDDYISLGDWLTDSAFTISMWVNPDLQNGWATIIDNNHISTSNWVFHTTENWQTNGYMFMTSSLIELDSNKWSHLILSYSTGEVKVYVKGQLKSQSQGILNFDLPVSLFLGKRGRDNDGFGGSRYWKGKLDDLGIWNRALTESEITNLYQSIVGIHTENIGLGVSIYPNPTGESKEFLVRFADNPQQDIHIELLDILGSVLYSNRLQAGSESCTIPVHSLSSGMYMIRVRMNNEVYMEKVIVN